MNITEKITKHLVSEAGKPNVKDILSKRSVIGIKGSVAYGSSVLTKEVEAHLLNNKSFLAGKDYVVDWTTYEKITQANTVVLKKWHLDNGLPYFGK
jgi:hypothetical protein